MTDRTFLNSSQLLDVRTKLNSVSSDVDALVDAGYNATGLTAELAGKAAATHSHAISAITNLQTTLDGKASVSALTSLSDDVATRALAADLTSGLAGKANTAHTHAATDITGLSTEVGAFLAASDADGARDAIGASNAFFVTLSASEALSLVPAHDGGGLYLSGSAPVLTIEAEASQAYPDAMGSPVFFEAGGTIQGASGVSINGVDGGTVTVGAYGAATIVRIAADTWVVPDPGGAGGGDPINLPIEISDVNGLSTALAGKYSDATTVIADIGAELDADKFAFANDLFSDIRSPGAILQFSAVSPYGLVATQPVVLESLTFSDYENDTYTGKSVRPEVTIEPYAFKTVAGTTSMTLDIGAIGGPNVLIDTETATNTITVVTPTKVPAICIVVRNSGGGARDVTLNLSGAAGQLTIKPGAGVNTSANLGSTAGDMLMYVLLIIDPANDTAILTAATEI